VDGVDRPLHPTPLGGDRAALSAINPKNLILTIGAAAAIAETGAAAGCEAVAVAVFVLIGTLGCAVPVALFFLMGERAAQVLTS
jgi:hypothetical protein